MSTPPLKLISHNLCPYVQRAVIVLHEKKISHEREYIDLSNKPSWFHDISPLGKVPLLQAGKEVLFESAIICEYLDEITPGSLHPAEPLKKARHRAWIEFGSNILNEIAGFYSAKDRATFEVKQQTLINKFKTLEQQLQEGSFFEGDRFSLVDAVYGPIFRYFSVFKQYKDFCFFTDTPKISSWQDTLLSRESIATAVLPSYPQLLHEFLLKKKSYLSQLIQSNSEGAYESYD